MDQSLTAEIKFSIFNKSAYAKKTYFKGFFLNILQKLQANLKSKLELYREYSAPHLKINSLLYLIYQKSDIITRSLIVISCQTRLLSLYINNKDVEISHERNIDSDDGKSRAITYVKITGANPYVISYGENTNQCVTITADVTLPETMVSSLVGQPLKNIVEMPTMFKELGDKPIFSAEQRVCVLDIMIKNESGKVASTGKKEIGIIRRYLKLKAVESVTKEVPFQIHLIVGILSSIKFFMISNYDPALMIFARMFLGFIIGISLFNLFIALKIYEGKMAGIKKSITINIPE